MFLQNTLSWKRATRISEFNSWPFTRHPNRPTRTLIILSKRCLSSGSLGDRYSIVPRPYTLLTKLSCECSAESKQLPQDSTKVKHVWRTQRSVAHENAPYTHGRAGAGDRRTEQPRPCPAPALAPYGSAVPASARGGQQLRAALMAAAAAPLSPHRLDAAIFPARPPNAFRVGATTEAERPCRGCPERRGGLVEELWGLCRGGSPVRRGCALAE